MLVRGCSGSVSRRRSKSRSNSTAPCFNVGSKNPFEPSPRNSPSIVYGDSARSTPCAQKPSASHTHTIRHSRRRTSAIGIERGHCTAGEHDRENGDGFELEGIQVAVDPAAARRPQDETAGRDAARHDERQERSRRNGRPQTAARNVSKPVASGFSHVGPPKGGPTSVLEPLRNLCSRAGAQCTIRIAHGPLDARRATDRHCRGARPDVAVAIALLDDCRDRHCRRRAHARDAAPGPARKECPPPDSHACDSCRARARNSGCDRSRLRRVRARARRCLRTGHTARLSISRRLGSATRWRRLALGVVRDRERRAPAVSKRALKVLFLCSAGFQPRVLRGPEGRATRKRKTSSGSS